MYNRFPPDLPAHSAQYPSNSELLGQSQRLLESTESPSGVTAVNNRDTVIVAFEGNIPNIVPRHSDLLAYHDLLQT